MSNSVTAGDVAFTWFFLSIGFANIIFIIYTIARLFFKLVLGLPRPIESED